MAVNQYIGARYVPLIKGEWDSTQAYEPLTVVLYQGSSYTSICSVPIGIPPTNTAFWALTGNYNAQVEEYRQEVINAVDEVNKTVGDTVTNLTGQYANLDATLKPGFNLAKTFGCTTLFDTQTTEYMNNILQLMSENYNSVILKVQVYWNNGISFPENINEQVSILNNFKDKINISGIKFHTYVSQWVASGASIDTVLSSLKVQTLSLLNTIPFDYENVWLFNEDSIVFDSASISKIAQFISDIKTATSKKISIPTRNTYDATNLKEPITSLMDFFSVNIYGNVSPYGKLTTIQNIVDFLNESFTDLTNLRKSKPIVVTETGVCSSWNKLTDTGSYSQDGEGTPISLFYEAFYKSRLMEIVDGVFWWYYYDAITYAPTTLKNIKYNRGVRYE